MYSSLLHIIFIVQVQGSKLFSDKPSDNPFDELFKEIAKAATKIAEKLQLRFDESGVNVDEYVKKFKDSVAQTNVHFHDALEKVSTFYFYFFNIHSIINSLIIYETFKILAK